MSEFDSEAENKRMEEFQDALVELLAGSSSPCVIMETMRIDDRFAEYRDYIEQFDPDMIEVAVSWLEAGLSGKMLLRPHPMAICYNEPSRRLLNQDFKF